MAAADPTTTTPSLPKIQQLIESASAAQTLTLSDQHANILLSHINNGNEIKKSILKITVVPVHKEQLAVSVDASNGEELSTEEPANTIKNENSSRVKGFLSAFDWRLTSERCVLCDVA